MSSPMTDRELAGCPFCGCGIYLVTNRDWHRLAGLHDDGCMLEEWDMSTMVPATDEDLEQLVAAWNCRAPSRDEVRLDWLERYAHCADWDDHQPLKRIVRGDDGDEFCADTWREAIDAAIAAAEGENHG